MSNDQGLIRLVYASRATFKPFSVQAGLEGHVAQILSTARRENKKNHLVGALYYGDGCFFQCLEGESNVVYHLYERLKTDRRHKDLKILYSHAIEQRSFSDWEMKYSAVEHQVRDFLHHHGMRRFDPYRFDADMTLQLVSMIDQAAEQVKDSTLENAVVEARQYQLEDRGLSAQGLIALLMSSVIVGFGIINFA